MPLRDLPIRRKLMLILLLTSAVVMVLMRGAFFTYEYIMFRHETVRQLTTLGEIIAANSTAALAFANEGDAKEILSALKADRHVVAGALYDRNGRLFAHYPETLAVDLLPVTPGEPGYYFGQSHLSGFQTVTQKERVQASNQQLRAANAELESFSYSVSHDLRAPLRHIDGFAGLLGKSAGKQLSERGRGYLSNISDSAKQMGVLIDDLLVFSRMGRTEMNLAPVNLQQLAEETVQAFQRQEAKDREISWKVGTLPVVRGDKPMLRQVFVNLLSNAIKYSRPRNPAEIEIGCFDEAGEVVVFVRDNGVGFEMQYAQKLFGVFQRLHRAEEFEGTGIGLANVRRIVTRHGGRTWAESSLDAGATFYFSLVKYNTPNT